MFRSVTSLIKQNALLKELFLFTASIQFISSAAKHVAAKKMDGYATGSSSLSSVLHTSLVLLPECVVHVLPGDSFVFSHHPRPKN
jgi:hypothetical protein